MSHWASRGVVVVQPCHADAFSEVIQRYPGLGLSIEDRFTHWQKDSLTQGLFLSFVMDPVHRETRLTEVADVLRRVEQIAAKAGFAGSIEPQRIAVGGHSYGAMTTAAFAGVPIDLLSGRAQQLRPRPLAGALMLSPPAPGSAGLNRDGWSKVGMPLMMLTGTLDVSAANTDPTTRTDAFRLCEPGGRYLAVMDDCDHGFGGISFTGRKHVRESAEIRRSVISMTSAFWEAILLQNDTAMEWLRCGPMDPAISYRGK